MMIDACLIVGAKFGIDFGFAVGVPPGLGIGYIVWFLSSREK